MHSQALQDLPDGTLDLEQLELAVQEAHGSRYHPRPELICLENTHSSAGGRALPLAHLQQVGAGGGRQGGAHGGAGGSGSGGHWWLPGTPVAALPLPRSTSLRSATGCGCTWTERGC